ncbi:MAG: crossover junction endodeoxyribonuclease RuvC [Alphaproteobacteria bacterium]|jgi:crossover junction endodeoxyribonuclease RuvC|nr:crossover junction endodeoxyribonuclease RuvC [Alphaproteobacteria bacterium]
MRLIGLDPGLRATGWGVIEADGGHLRHIADGVVRTKSSDTIALRLVQIYDAVAQVIETYQPQGAAVEETFVNRNPQSTLKLGLARGVVLLAPARAGLAVAEYGANQVKKSVTGAGHAAKDQVKMMVKTLLPAAAVETADAADALAVAICHAHFSETRGAWGVGGDAFDETKEVRR